MEVNVSDNPGSEQFDITADGEQAGHAAYRRRPGVIAFIHTEIDPKFEGQGLGGKLVEAALSSAAAEEIDVLPFCPFVNKYISEHHEFLPLVPEAMRAQFGLS